MAFLSGKEYDQIAWLAYVSANERQMEKCLELAWEMRRSLCCHGCILCRSARELMTMDIIGAA